MSANPRHKPVFIPEAAMDLPGEDELPYDFGPPMETDLHRSGMNELIDALRAWLAKKGVTNTFVGGNMALYFSTEQIKKNDFLGPDFFVARPTSMRSRKSWVMWQELVGPIVVIELLSATTEKNDRNAKMAIYSQILRVPEYYLFDPIDGRLEGYRLSHQGMYVIIPPDPAHEEPVLDCLELGLRLGVRWDPSPEEGEVPHLRWMEPDGRWVPTPIEFGAKETARADQQTVRADQQTARAEEADRLAKAERERAEEADRLAKAERARAEEADRRAKAERERAEEANRLAKAERERALEAEARAQRLAARLRALGLDPES